MFEDLDKKEKDREAGAKSENTFNVNNFLASKLKSLSSGKPKLAALAPLTPAISDLENRIRKLEEKGRKRGRRYSKIGIISSFIIALAVMASGYYILTEIIKFTGETNEIIGDLSDMNRLSNNRLMIKGFWRQCSADNDCVETKKDCCSCENGGTQTAINTKSLALWEKELSSRCKNKVCSAVYNCQSGTSVCQSGRCVFNKSEIQPEPSFIDASSTQSIVDSDNDGLSDTEEIKYGTKIDNSDTDGDGYSDSDEVKRGYNPAGEGILNK